MLNRDCPKCEGTGRYRDSRIWGTMPGSAACDNCDGTGKLSRPAKPSVPPPVPPGVREAWGVGGAGPGRPPTPDGDSASARNGAVATPFVESYDPQTDDPIIGWEWNICPDCGKHGAHPMNHMHDWPLEKIKARTGGIRCG